MENGLSRMGLVPTSLIDYPGHMSCVVFTQGCNFRCPWCHNPGLVLPPYDQELLTLDEINSFLHKRKNVLKALVVTGGEPLMHSGLPDWLRRVKALGYQIKLDTNGAFPQVLEDLEDGLVDYVAMDVKNAPELYSLSTGVTPNIQNLSRSVDIIKHRYPEKHEFRLTWVPELNTLESLESLAAFIGAGPSPLFITGFRSGKTVHPDWAQKRSPTEQELDQVVEALVKKGIKAVKR